MMLERHGPVGVIQICAIAPAPLISAITFASPGSITTYGETFHPRPSFRAGLFDLSGCAIAPLPFSPVGFSGLIDRLSAVERIERLPMCMPSPLNDTLPSTGADGAGCRYARRENGGFSFNLVYLAPFHHSRLSSSAHSGKVARPGLAYYIW